MSALADLLFQLTEAAKSPGALERVGSAFNKGAALPGTFERGRGLADTPERLAAQFDVGAPESLGMGVTRFGNPKDPGSGGVLTEIKDIDELRSYLRGENALGMSGGFENPGSLPSQAKFHLYDTAGLGNSTGVGKGMYPNLYAHTLADPNAYNVKAGLSGDNSHRVNYNLASMIMRRPDAGKRLLTSHSQFEHLLNDVEPVRFRTESPDYQVGALQSEGALQLLRRLGTAAKQHAGGPTQQYIEDLPGRLSSQMPKESIEALARRLRAQSNSMSLRTIGPASMRKFGIVQDALQGRQISPAAFRGLEFKGGGPVHAPTCTCRTCLGK